MHHILSRCKPLAFYGGDLFVEHKGALCVLDDAYRPRPVCGLPWPKFGRVVARSKALTRALRLGVYSAGVHGDVIYVSLNGRLYAFSPGMGALEESFVFPRGRGPLQFASIRGIAGFGDQVAFGEYIGNPTKGAVHIYRKRDAEARWEIAYTFAAGEINHIHGIVPDPRRGCCWVLTGDFDGAPRLLMATDDFRTLTPALDGSQQARACVAFPIEGGLLYATDTQLEPNAIRLLEPTLQGGWTSKPLCALNGPCIYGHETASYYVFSTATEPDAHRYRSTLRKLLDASPAPVIAKNQSDIVLCAKRDLRCQLLTSRAKDCLPYRLFQFGSVMFPAGQSPDDTLFFYNVGARSSDLALEVLRV